MGADWPLGFMPYGNRWRTHRRLFHRFFNVSTVERFDPRLFKGIRSFLKRLAESPEDFADHTRLYVAFWLRSEPKARALTSRQKARRFTYPLYRIWHRGRLSGRQVLFECPAGDLLPRPCSTSRNLPRGLDTVPYASTQVHPHSSTVDITLQSSTCPAGYLGPDSMRSQTMREVNWIRC